MVFFIHELIFIKKLPNYGFNIVKKSYINKNFHINNIDYKGTYDFCCKSCYVKMG